ncbi:MAG: CheR family methyltransferase [Myxococcaceae bacterium]
MTTLLQQAEIQAVEHVLEQATGISLSAGLRGVFEYLVASAAKQRQVELPRFVQLLQRGDGESVRLLCRVCLIHETYFFRTEEHFGLLGTLFAQRPGEPSRPQPLRIWSAACATGEEAYSIAISLLKAGIADAEVLGTDISEQALERAAVARYGSWSLRGDALQRVSPFLVERPGAVWEVTAEAKRPVRFLRHNLVAEPPPKGPFDVVFCRNVLIYFDRARATRVLQGIFESLKEGGILLLTSAELPCANGLPFEAQLLSGVTLLRRPSGSSSPSASPAAALPPARRRRVPPPRAAASATSPVACSTLDLVRPPPPPESDRFALARAAVARGDSELAERLALAAGNEELLVEGFLLVATLREARGDLRGALAAARRALYLEPSLAAGHATLANLHGRLGERAEAERAKQSVLRCIQALDDQARVRGLGEITVGALRRALQESLQKPTR